MSPSRLAAALSGGLFAAAALILAHHPPQLAEIPRLATAALLGSLAMAAIACAGSLLGRSQPEVALGLRRGSLTPIRIAGLAVGTVGLSHLLSELLVRLDLRQESVLPEIERSIAGAAGWEYGLLIAALAVGPGLAEELLFRGLILRGLARIYGSGVALLGSSVLFGLAHLDKAQGSAAALLGLYLGAVALKGGSIRASVICHIVNNIAAVTWLAFSSASNAAAGPAGWVSWVALAASLAATVVGLVTLAVPNSRSAS